MSASESQPAQQGMSTPVYLKEEVGERWPDDPVFYVLASNGLSLGRNHEMFRSCTRVHHGPSELAEQESFLEPRYPELPQVLFEQLVGFFSEMAKRHGCEVGAYLICNRETKVVTARVPKQLTTVSESYYGSLWPIGMEYDNLEPLPPEEMIFGTIHSHVYGAAYSSGVDVHDELDKPGVHLVVGKLDKEPADFHVEAVVDGARFELDIREVIEGYGTRRDDYPSEWIDRVEVKVNRWSNTPVYGKGGYTYGGSYGGSYGSGSTRYYRDDVEDKKDNGGKSW